MRLFELVNGDFILEVVVDVALALLNFATKRKGIKSPVLCVPLRGDVQLLEQGVDARQVFVSRNLHPRQEVVLEGVEVAKLFVAILLDVGICSLVDNLIVQEAMVFKHVAVRGVVLVGLVVIL